jgi:hypothetical protein
MRTRAAGDDAAAAAAGAAQDPQAVEVLRTTLQLRWLRSQVSWPPLLRLPAVACL